MKKKLAILMASIIAVMAIVMFTSTIISADEQTEVTQIDGTEYTYQYTIMKPDLETVQEWIELYNSAPQAYIDPKIKMMIEQQSAGTSFDLLDHLEYDPIERNQGDCGNCWVWAGTGILEVALSVQEGTKDRHSVQYLTSCYQGGSGEDWACCGGWGSYLADWYQTNGFDISWSNTNAHWQDGNRMCADLSTSVPCESISTSPNYPITDCTATRIETHEVGKETAIANIKNVLHQDKAVDFGFFLPNNADWGNFYDFWSNDPENTIWNPDFSCGHTWVENEGGGHAVLCVGYDDTDPDNSYWIMLNSWGTTEGRPNGLFLLDMDMDYDCYYIWGSYWDYSLFWDTLDVTFDIVEEPKVSIETDKFKYCPGDTMLINIDISNPTSNPVTFKWYLGVPTFGYWGQRYTGTLPAGFEDTFEVPFHIDEWGATPFSAVWYVDLQDPETGQELTADCACWSYCPTCGKTAAMSASIPTMPPIEDITKELREKIEGIA